MDAEQIHQPGPKLDRFLAEFANCFARKDTRAPLGVHVRGQLSDLAQKSVEPIALEAGVAPRTLQEFLSQHANRQLIVQVFPTADRSVLC